MLDILREKQLYENWMLATLPLMAVSSTLKAGLILSVITVLAMTLSALCLFALRSFLNEKTALFAQLVIAVGVVGVASTLLRIVFDEDITGLGIYVSIAAVSAVLMLRSDFIINTDVVGLLSGCGISAAVGAAFLVLSSLIREFLGFGSVLGFDIYTKYFTPIAFFTTPAGGLLTAAILATVYGFLAARPAKEGEAKR